MKKQKLHPLPLETPFLRKIKTGVQYYDQSHYTNFDGNSVEIRPFKQPPRDEHWSTDIIFRKILTSLNSVNMKYLRRLEISIEASYLFNKATLRHFASTLAHHFKTLNLLDIRFLSCLRPNCESLRDFLSCFVERMKNLTQISLHFLGESDIDNTCLKDLKSLVFKKCKQLKKLEVIVSGICHEFLFEKNYYFDPDMDKWLSQKTSYHDEALSYDVSSITPKGAGLLCSNLGRYCKKLEFLAFEIPVSIGQSQMKIERFVKMITKMTNLKCLNLSFAAQVNDEYIDKVSFIIGQKLKKLKSLSLWFHRRENKEVTDKGLEKLALNIFPALSKLTYFAFCLDNCDGITDRGVANFGTDIANNLKNLESLILNFYGSESLTRPVPSKLTQAFKNSLLSLRKLVLNFQWIDELNRVKEKERYSLFPEKVENLNLYLHIADCFMKENWANLKQLSVVIGNSSEDTDFLDMFSKESPILKNLTQLKLVFVSPNKVTDEKVGELTLAIGRNLQTLKSLELGFSYCQLLTSKSFLLIGENLCPNLKQLQHFHLRFYEVESSKPEDLILLVKFIAMRLPELESLTLFFFGVLKRSKIKSTLDSICPLITECLKKLRRLTFELSTWRGYEMNEEDDDDDDDDDDEEDEEAETEVKQQMRRKLCHIPNLYLS